MKRIALAALAALTLASAVQAAPKPDAEFAAWKAAHPNLEAKIADLKTKTASLIANYVAYIPVLTPQTQMDPARLHLLQPPVVWRVKGGIAEIWDDPVAPKMTVVPAGEYTMGSPADEPERRENEGPQRRVRMAYPFAVSTYPITIGQFRAFIADSGYDAGNQCQTFKAGKWENIVGCSWKAPGFAQTETSPVVTLDWNGAKAYVAWLAKKTGQKYRLLSEAEYEYVARAGTTTTYWWGDDAAKACDFANGADLDAKAQVAQFNEWTVNACHDGHALVADQPDLKPNPFGLYGITGNTWSWTADCWTETYHAAPIDGSAWTSGNCAQPVIRGGSWAELPEGLRSARRGWNFANIRFTTNSFRVARDL